MPNTVISFSIFSEGFDAILEISDLGLEVDDVGLVLVGELDHSTLQPLHHLLHGVSLPQEVPAFLIPIGGPLSDRFVSHAFHSSPHYFLGNSLDVLL